MAKARTTGKPVENLLNEQSTAPALAMSRHKFRLGLQTAINELVSMCDERNIRLTPLKRRTLKIFLESHFLLESHFMLRAYQIHERLAQGVYGEKSLQVYRTLDAV